MPPPDQPGHRGLSMRTSSRQLRTVKSSSAALQSQTQRSSQAQQHGHQMPPPPPPAFATATSATTTPSTQQNASSRRMTPLPSHVTSRIPSREQQQQQQQQQQHGHNSSHNSYNTRSHFANHHHNTRSHFVDHHHSQPPAPTGPPAPESRPTVEKLMKQSAEGTDVSGQLAALKRAVLLDGISSEEGSGMSAHRVYAWLVLLQAPLVSYAEYGALLARGASPAYAKIDDDVHRTLATDPLFLRRVSQNSISRVLNALAWVVHDRAAAKAAAAASKTEPSKGGEQQQQRQVTPPATQQRQRPTTAATTTTTVATQDPAFAPESIPLPATPPPLSRTGLVDPHAVPLPPSPPRPNHENNDKPDNPSSSSSPYVQGMNVLAAPLLYASRSEPQAFTLLHTLITREIPAYVSPTMPGVHAGLALLDRCLALLDPPLHAHLAARGVGGASAYAFPSIATLSACTPPLPEVLRLWDFLFAYGPHLNVLAVAAQLVLMRDKLLASRSPGKELRSLQPLVAKRVVDMVLVFVGRLDGSGAGGGKGGGAGAEGRGLYREIVAHTHVK